MTAITPVCQPAAEQDTDAAAAIPLDQWSLVNRVTISEFHCGAVNLKAGDILPRWSWTPNRCAKRSGIWWSTPMMVSWAGSLS
jgi:hypothetical protein